MKYAFVVENLSEMSERLKNLSGELTARGIAANSVFNARLASCELLTNAIVHGGESAAYECEVLPDRLKITVTANKGAAYPLDSPCPDILSETGRGIYIVRSVCLGEIERGEGVLTVYIGI